MEKIASMQNSQDGYWNQISTLNVYSKSVLSQHELLLQKLDDLNQKLGSKETELYNIETRLENLDIFEQHLTSLNLRCQFLDKQISNLELKQKPKTASNKPSLSPLDGMRGFKDRSNIAPILDTPNKNIKIEWKTTETTLDNLCTEFKYLQDQLNIANNHTNGDLSITDDSTFSHYSTDKSASLFSESDTLFMDEDVSNYSTILPTKEKRHDTHSHYNSNPQNVHSNNNAHKKKKLLKMESFLNFTDNMQPSIDSTIENNEHEVVPLRGFKINTLNENPLQETSQPKLPMKGKESIKSVKKKLELVDLPSIVEEEFNTPNEINGNVIEQSFLPSEEKFHRRHSSLPETSSLDDNNIMISSAESIRHITSYDTGLNSRFNSKNYNVTDFLFLNPAEIEHKIVNKSSSNTILDETTKRNTSGLMSSSPFSTFKASYIDDESYHEQPNASYPQSQHSIFFGSDNGIDSNYNHVPQNESDSDESYGDENATPLILKKESKLSLYRCNSHESIFSTMSKSTRNFPLREKNLDLKAQTMKWLKPNIPTVSSSQQPFVTAKNTTTINNNAHDDIINILHSGTNKDADSTPSTPLKSTSNTQIEQTPSSIVSKPRTNSFFSGSLMTPSSTTPMNINKNTSLSESTSSDGPISSWFSNIIPNSAFTNPEVGKIIGQPSGQQINPKSSVSSSQSRLNASPFTFTPVNFRKVKPNMNGSSSSLTINKNHERIITHGYGSGFNKRVVSSRVSHGALREALECDMI